MDKSTAWDYAIGLIKVDGLEPSPEFLEMVEKEKRGEHGKRIVVSLSRQLCWAGK